MGNAFKEAADLLSDLWLDKIVLSGRAGHIVYDSLREAFDLARDQKILIEVELNGTKVTIDGRRH